MAKPVQLAVENMSTPTQGYLAIQVKQGDEVVSSATIHYSRQGELMTAPGEPDEMERRATLLNDLLLHFNDQLDQWCS